MDLGRNWLVYFNVGRMLFLFDWSNNTGAIEVKMHGSVKEKLFTMLGSTLSSELNWSSYICIAKTASKTGNLICSMKFLSPAVALYFHESTLQPCMEYCCYVWTGASSSYLELISYKNRYAELPVLHLLPRLNPWPSKCSQFKSFLCITLVDVHLNWLD